MTDATLSLIVLGVTVVLFVWNVLPVGVVAILCALALYATGLVDSTTAVSGFGDPVVVFIATLFVLAAGLESAGVTAWVGRALVRGASGRNRLLVAVMGLTAVLSAVVTPSGAAAALLPVVVMAARQSGLAPARMLMPMAFAASAGALLVLSGSPVNVIVSDALLSTTGVRFNFFEFALIGLPITAVTVLVAVLWGDRLLPHREPGHQPADLSDHLSTVIDHYDLEHGFLRVGVQPESALVGVCPGELGLPGGVRLIGAQRAAGEQRASDDPLQAGDVLVLTGGDPEVADFVETHGLTVVATPLTRDNRDELLGTAVGVAEVVVAPRSDLIGERMYPGQVRPTGLTVLGLRRMGRELGASPTPVMEGDMILLHGPWDAVEDLARNDKVLLVNDPALLRQQAAPLGSAAWRAVGVLVVFVALLASGVVTPAVAGLIGVVGMVGSGVLTPQQAHRAVSWQTVILIGALIPLSTAIETSGAADLIAARLVDLVGGGSARMLLAAVFLLTLVLGQVVSNTATVLVVTPIALAAAQDAGVGVAPVLMTVAVAGAASFLTPIATPANMIVMGPAGYRFGDYWKLGLTTTVGWFVVAVGLIPLIWPAG